MRSIAVVLMLVLFAVSFAVSAPPAAAQTLETITLPAPQRTGGMPLMEAFQNRQSGREFATREIPVQVLSNLLWAANGFNREDKRTVPTASNKQEQIVYVVNTRGIYRYEAKEHALVQIVAGDHRAATGSQPYVGEAPMNLVYVADYSKMGGTDQQKAVTSGTDTGFISQNVYLYCAQEGLSTVVRGLVDREKLSPIMKLGPDLQITYAQTVGYPAQQ